MVYPPLIKSLIELNKNKPIKKFEYKLHYAFCGTAYLDKELKNILISVLELIF